jgi:outer membrane protein assembly factor BamE (lipoprotein component of BamABCDE complex)
MRKGFVSLSAAIVVIAGTAACAPVQNYSGFPIDNSATAPADPQVGVDTRDTVSQRFGTPSTTAALDQNSWFYISEVQSRVAFYTPHISDRHVMVVRFTGDTVSGVEKFGIERGRIVSYDTHTTPTRGRELGVLEQLLGNIGNTAQLPTQQDQQGGRPQNH